MVACVALATVASASVDSAFAPSAIVEVASVASASSFADDTRAGGNRDDGSVGMADNGKTAVAGASSFHKDFDALVLSSEAHSRVQADNGPYHVLHPYAVDLAIPSFPIRL